MEGEKERIFFVGRKEKKYCLEETKGQSLCRGGLATITWSTSNLQPPIFHVTTSGESDEWRVPEEKKIAASRQIFSSPYPGELSGGPNTRFSMYFITRHYPPTKMVTRGFHAVSSLCRRFVQGLCQRLVGQ